MKAADRSCRWFLASEAGAVEAECCHSAGHQGDHHVLFGYVPGSIAAGTEGDPGSLELADAEWQHPTGNPWSALYTGDQARIRDAYRRCSEDDLVALHRAGLRGELTPARLDALAGEYERRGLLP